MLQRWDPFRELRRMDENMNRIRRGGFNGFGEVGQWAVPLDVVQDGDNIVVKATLSGINPDDIDVTIEDGILTIAGETKEEHEEIPSSLLAEKKEAPRLFVEPRCVTGQHQILNLVATSAIKLP